MKQGLSFSLNWRPTRRSRTSSSSITDLHLARPAVAARVNMTRRRSRQFLPLLIRLRPRHSPPPTSRRTLFVRVATTLSRDGLSPPFVLSFVSSHTTSRYFRFWFIPDSLLDSHLSFPRVSTSVSFRTPPYSSFSYASGILETPHMVLFLFGITVKTFDV